LEITVLLGFKIEIMSKLTFQNKKVFITGAASGIGKIMGRKALERGASHLIIWDINQESLLKVKQEFASYDAIITTYVIDVSDVDQIIATATKVKNEIGVVDILINNAGIVVGNYFLAHSHNDIARTMLINSNALMHIALEFLPGMKNQEFGAVCNIASSAGLISNPKMAVYVASKWAVTGWSDSLRIEMNQTAKNVSITTIMPYYINTGMFDGVKSKVIPILNPEKTAEKIIRAIENKAKMVSIPLPYWFIRITQGILPLSIYEWVMDKGFGIYDTMNDFKGRKQ
jgi:all-trans-retinol dehydrogenase (NAD+)